MTAKSKRAAAATQPGVAVAAESVLARGNAVDAVCAAVLMAAALEPGVLLGPLHILVAGPGHGLRCIDGRLRQPGRKAPRPRGFLTEREVPLAARVAVPALAAAIGTALSMFGTVTFRKASDPALAALTRGHPRRAVLSGLAREGASWLAKPTFSEMLVSVAGRLVGGQVTVDDLRDVRAPALAPTVDHGIATAPVSDSNELDTSECHVVCAADWRGGVAAACYEIARDGLAIDACGLIAPLRAAPVMRGERRVEPGASLSCATTIALLEQDASFGFAGPDAAAHLTEVAANLVRGRTLADALSHRAPSVGVVVAEGNARSYSFTP